MKPIDPHTAARVWDRVQNTVVPAPDAQSILNQISEELLDSALWQQLARKLPPSQAAIARQLSSQEQSHAACLKGIYAMITGRMPIVPPTRIGDDPPEIVLRRCYGRKMRIPSQYESRQSDPQFGHVFKNLARQEQEHCHRILEILGAITK
jgi:hypothetical protein